MTTEQERRQGKNQLAEKDNGNELLNKGEQTSLWQKRWFKIVTLVASTGAFLGAAGTVTAIYLRRRKEHAERVKFLMEEAGSADQIVDIVAGLAADGEEKTFSPQEICSFLACYTLPNYRGVNGFDFARLHRQIYAPLVSLHLKERESEAALAGKERRQSIARQNAIRQILYHYQQELRIILGKDYTVLPLPQTANHDWQEIACLFTDSYSPELAASMALAPSMEEFGPYTVNSPFEWLVVRESKRWRLPPRQVYGSVALYVCDFPDTQSTNFANIDLVGIMEKRLSVKTPSELEKASDLNGKTLVIGAVSSKDNCDAIAAGLLGAVDYALQRKVKKVLLPLHQFTTGVDQTLLTPEVVLGIFPEAESLGTSETFFQPALAEPVSAQWWILYDEERIHNYQWLQTMARNSIFRERTFID